MNTYESDFKKSVKKIKHQINIVIALATNEGISYIEALDYLKSQLQEEIDLIDHQINTEIAE